MEDGVICVIIDHLINLLEVNLLANYNLTALPLSVLTRGMLFGAAAAYMFTP
jgi:hypothetical protein